MKKKRILVAAGLLCILPLSSCEFIENIVSTIIGHDSVETPVSSETVSSDIISSNPVSSDTNSSEDSSVSVDSSTTKTFKHTFTKGDFTDSGTSAKAGTVKINGLTWSFDELGYINSYTGGVQLGSSNNPLSKWTLSTELPEGCSVVSYGVTVSNAKSGRADCTVEFGDHSSTKEFNSDQGVQTIYENDLNVSADTFSITISDAEKAVYLYALTLTLTNPDGIDENIGSDGGDGTPVTPGEGDIPETAYPLISAEQYYTGVDLNLTGDALRDELHSKISEMTVYDYGDARYTLLYTDESLDNPGYDLGLWDGDLIKAEWGGGGSWQREHVWAASHLGLPDGEDGHGNSEKGAQSDLHNLRIACGPTNNYHSNRFYGNEDVVETAGSEGYFFPNVDVSDNLSGIHNYTGDWKGDAARIIFYMAVRYDNLKLNDNPNSDPSCSMGDLSVLLEWNKEDPVDDFEIQRNNRIYEYQGNRNPFIDDSALADAIWG